MQTPTGPDLILERGFAMPIYVTIKTSLRAVYDLTGKSVVLRIGTEAVAAIITKTMDVIDVSTGECSTTITAAESAIAAGTYRYHFEVVEDDRMVLRGACVVRDDTRAA